MTASEFASLLKSPTDLNSISYQDLENLLMRYSYCQSLRFLLLKKIKEDNHPAYQRHLALAATYASDRRFLYSFLNDGEGEVREQTPILKQEINELPVLAEPIRDEEVREEVLENSLEEVFEEEVVKQEELEALEQVEEVEQTEQVEEAEEVVLEAVKIDRGFKLSDELEISIDDSELEDLTYQEMLAAQLEELARMEAEEQGLAMPETKIEISKKEPIIEEAPEIKEELVEEVIIPEVEAEELPYEEAMMLEPDFEELEYEEVIEDLIEEEVVAEKPQELLGLNEPKEELKLEKLPIDEAINEDLLSLQKEEILVEEKEIIAKEEAKIELPNLDDEIEQDKKALIASIEENPSLDTGLVLPLDDLEQEVEEIENRGIEEHPSFEAKEEIPLDDLEQEVEEIENSGIEEEHPSFEAKEEIAAPLEEDDWDNLSKEWSEGLEDISLEEIVIEEQSPVEEIVLEEESSIEEVANEVFEEEEAFAAPILEVEEPKEEVLAEVEESKEPFRFMSPHDLELIEEEENLLVAAWNYKEPTTEPEEIKEEEPLAENYELPIEELEQDFEETPESFELPIQELEQDEVIKEYLTPHELELSKEEDTEIPLFNQELPEKETEAFVEELLEEKLPEAVEFPAEKEIEEELIIIEETEEPKAEIYMEEPDSNTWTEEGIKEKKEAVEFIIENEEQLKDETPIEEPEAAIEEEVITPEAELSQFTSWLSSLKAPAEKKEPQAKKEDDFEEVTELAAKSVREDDDTISESLADILALQGKTRKASLMYQRLSLKFPEKSAYFAEKINKLKNK